MKLASLHGGGNVKNFVFNIDHPSNRDNCYYAYWLLKNLFFKYSIEINTIDVNKNKQVMFEIHMDAKRNKVNVPTYVLLLETPIICPDNQRPDILAAYRKIFTWNDVLVDEQRYVKINFPNKIEVNSTRGWQGRDRLCCMIAGNKSVSRASSLELYSARIKSIRWFERHAPQDFDLFGIGWDAPPTSQGLLGRVWGRLHRALLVRDGKVYFPSYRGKVVSKLETMQRYRFSICYENVREMPGYITEKIFDSFFAGCVPVYWGAPNITDYIPATCFVDRRNFATHDELHKFMTSMSEAVYIGYQEAIAAFLQSDQARPFSAEVFAETIVQTIVSDLGLTA